MWKFGKVVNELKEFEEAITESISYNQYNEIQKILKSEFIYTTEKSSSDMFADFITKKVC